ncbi:GNAT family N-acetyltransferase [Ensifer canadensis]
MTSHNVSLTIADTNDLPDFKKELQEAFAVAVIEEFGGLPDGPIPSDDDLDKSIHAPGAVALRILCEGRKVGGAVVTIDEKTHHNSLDLFFLKVGEHGQGLGHKAWLAIEARYSQTVQWQTHTPYFEKRNIHFYVNKCGFKIIAFFHAHHLDPNHTGTSDLAGSEGFQFEKVMR